MRHVNVAVLALGALWGCVTKLEVTDETASGGTGAASGGSAGQGVTDCSLLTEEEASILLDQDFREHPPTWTPHPKNDPACPATPPEPSICDTEALACGYTESGPQVYSEVCTCSPATGGMLLWSCEVPPDPCPVEQPVPGSACPGLVGSTCNRDGVDCWCLDLAGSASWDCASHEERIAKMEAINPSTPVTQLTRQQQVDYCRWLSDAQGGGELLQTPSPLSAAGCTLSTGFTRRLADFNRACVPNLAVGQCVGNLAVTECRASIAQLTDCVRSVWTDVPAPYGCAPYLDSPGCSGTIAVAQPSPVEPTVVYCSVRVGEIEPVSSGTGGSGTLGTGGTVGTAGTASQAGASSGGAGASAP